MTVFINDCTDDELLVTLMTNIKAIIVTPIQGLCPDEPDPSKISRSLNSFQWSCILFLVMYW